MSFFDVLGWLGMCMCLGLVTDVTNYYAWRTHAYTEPSQYIEKNSWLLPYYKKTTIFTEDTYPTS
jgi:hypothetical protein